MKTDIPLIFSSTVAFSLLIMALLSFLETMGIIDRSIFIYTIYSSLTVFTASVIKEIEEKSDIERVELHLFKGLTAFFLHILLGGGPLAAIVVGGVGGVLSPFAILLLMLLPMPYPPLFWAIILTPIVYSLVFLVSSPLKRLADRS